MDFFCFFLRFVCLRVVCIPSALARLLFGVGHHEGGAAAAAGAGGPGGPRASKFGSVRGFGGLLRL